MIGIVARGPVDHALAFHDGVVVRERYRFRMRDQESMEMTCRRRPRAHPRAGAGPVQVNRAPRTSLMAATVHRKMLLVGAPTQFRGLRALADKPIYRPGIDELVCLLR